ncbi:MAG: insulinase family protein [Alphaproteobacteria bacterium]|nr:insulinase family protein [Alphaproteobacteria bacterium]
MTSIQITTLPNGLRVATDSVPSVDSVAVGVWIGVGARHEDLAYNGTAHMVEHMLFKGTKKRDAREIAEVIENVGGHMNAYTGREITSYHIHLLKEDLPLALDVLSDIVQHSTMPEDEVERERGVILQEIGMCADTPDDIIFDHYFETAYPDQTLGAPILGTTEIISAMQRKTLMDYVEKFYTPQNMVVCAAGNLDHETFVAQVAEQFCDLPADKDFDKAVAAYKGGENRAEKDLEQSHIILGFKGISRLSDQYYAAQVLSNLLGGGMASRLFQEIREKRGLVYSIYSFHSAFLDCGQFGVYAGTGPDKLPELVPVVCDEIVKLADTLTEEELDRAKAQLRATTLMARESMMRRVDQNAKSLIFRGKIRESAEIIESINNVDMGTTKDVCDAIFNGPVTLAANGPLKQLESLESIRKRLAA